MIRLYELTRGMGARPSWGSGEQAGVTMWLGENADDALSNPVSVTIYAKSGVVINFDYVRDKRSAEEMKRLAGLMREIPGVAGYIEGLEEQNYGMHRSMRAEDVLGSNTHLPHGRMP